MTKGELKICYQGKPNKVLDWALRCVLIVFGYRFVGHGFLYSTPDGVSCRSIVHATTARPRATQREVTPGGERDLVFLRGGP